MKRIQQDFRPGDSIRASWMRDISSVVNQHSRRLYQYATSGITDANGPNRIPPSAGGGGSMPTSLTFTEATRTSASRVGTDSNTDTETYDVATRIVMTASDGTNSYQWVFVYAT